MRLTMRNHKSYTYRASLIRVDNNCAIGDMWTSSEDTRTYVMIREIERNGKRKKHPGTVNRDAFSMPYCGLKPQI